MEYLNVWSRFLCRTFHLWHMSWMGSAMYPIYCRFIDWLVMNLTIARYDGNRLSSLCAFYYWCIEISWTWCKQTSRGSTTSISIRVSIWLFVWITQNASINPLYELYRLIQIYCKATFFKVYQARSSDEIIYK